MSKDNENEKSPKPKFKNRSERNAGYQTDAMKIFGNSPLLEKRPENMDREDYRLLRKIQTIVLKNLFHKGHSPNRKLSGIMGQKQPNIRVQSAPKRKINTPRRAS